MRADLPDAGYITDEQEMSENMTDNNKTTGIIMVGVGGQGILLASAIIANAAMLSGYQVKTNEVHGMAQRGGSVSGQIRYGHEVHSPLVAVGTASVIGSLEHVEALRMAPFLAPNGLCVVNAQEVIPVTVSMGAAAYPEDTHERLTRVFSNLIEFDAAVIAAANGSVRAANVALLGAMSTGLDLTEEAWHEAIAKCVKPKFVDINLKVFAAGRDYKKA